MACHLLPVILLCHSVGPLCHLDGLSKLFMSVAEIYEDTLMAEQQWPLCPLVLSGGCL